MVEVENQPPNTAPQAIPGKYTIQFILSKTTGNQSIQTNTLDWL